MQGPLPWRAQSLFGVACVAVIVLAVPHSRAEGKTSFLADQLQHHADFRVRMTAALSLGASDDADAVAPLCQCLDNGGETESVRVACAAGLGKLAKTGSETCLRAHASDASAKVKEQVGTSLRALGGGASSSTTCLGASSGDAKAKYYVGIAVLNRSSRPDGEIRPMVTREVRCKLAALGRFRFAPDDALDVKSMGSAIAKEKLDGWYLTVVVDPIKYEGGSLKVSMKLTLMTASRDLKGEIGKSLELPGIATPSKSDEDDLLKGAAQRLATNFAELHP